MNDRYRLTSELKTNFLVEAAAGTGKTTSMVMRMLKLVAEGECEPEHLAAVTFTRKAAAELRERFERELDAAIDRLQPSVESSELIRCRRLQAAAQSINQAFIGTIHSFCARLLRERPIEFGVNPGFRELEAEDGELLKERAWEENLADLKAVDHPLLHQLTALGLETSQLKDCFHTFVEFRDIEHWPCQPAPDFDLATCQSLTREYIEDMRTLIPQFPAERFTDELMSQYELIVRSSRRGFKNEAAFFRLLEHFDHSEKAVQKYWHDKKIAKREKDRFDAFRENTVRPALTYWRQRRYQCVVDYVRRALNIYQRLKQIEGALDFTDLLVTTAKGLREQAHLRAYFQQRITHLLVDEFQDTDPIQAEAVVLLCSTDCTQRDWQKCQLRPGSLFIVGDPKQSIYRFRRGDIVTYNRVKAILLESGGQVVSLADNFRSSREILEWNNSIFATKFPAEASDVAPAHVPMGCGTERAVRGGLSGVYRLPVEGKNRKATENEAEHIARFIRHAIATGKTIERWSSANDDYELTPVRASDFLIITRTRFRIDVFKRALERHGIDCEVSGSNSFSQNPNLQILLDVLRAADDPYNAVHYLSLLRERLFGFSDAELYALKDAEGSFLFTAPIPDKLDAQLRQRFSESAQLMSTFQFWLRSLPPVVALQKIATQLGLLAETAAEEDGNVALGSLLKAFEILRAESLNFDNTSDLIEGIERLLDIDEADSVSAIGSAEHSVRIMNLHKAKGLEAPIVILADTNKPPDHPPRVHINREQREPSGTMCIATQTKNPWGGSQWKTFAEPVDWAQEQARERTFLDAEEDRLLYVATTRAANMLIVSVGDKDSAWSDLHHFLADAPQLPIPTDDELLEMKRLAVGEIASSAAAQGLSWDTELAWQATQQPTYSIISVKKESLKGSRRPDWQSEEEYGMTWGIALHELLDIANERADADLHPHALNIAVEYGIAATRVAELVDTTQAVIASEIWKRSRAAARRYSELPFDLPSHRDGQPAIVRGVIDLIFEEDDGWVIVDYKSDSIDIEEVDSLCNYYKPQLADYARYWQTLTGFSVKEQGLYLTRHKKYCRLEP